MDLISKRYLSPLFFINNLIKNHCFVKGIKAIFDDIEEQKMWDLYCSSITARMILGDNRSFDDWKKGSSNSPKDKIKTMTNEEIMTTAEKSKNILETFLPN